MRAVDFTNAKVGDMVFSVVYGKGRIKEIDESCGISFPILVEFEINNINKTYSYSGYLHTSDLYPTLFWQEFNIPDKAFIKPRPNIEVNTPVWVWDIDKKYKRVGSFALFPSDGDGVEIFDFGTTSEHSNPHTSLLYFENYEVV